MKPQMRQGDTVKKRLMMGLLSAGLLAAMLPGVAVAKDKDDDKSDCKKGGWTDWVRDDGSAFADQAACVAYVAEGGTLTDPTPPPPPPADTFKSVCTSRGGTYVPDLKVTWAVTSPNCEWWVPISDNDYYTALQTLGTFCSFTVEGSPGTGVYSAGEDAGIDDPYAWWGCYATLTTRTGYPQP